MVDSSHDAEEGAEHPDRLGRAFQMRVDIAVALALVPSRLRRSLGDHNAAKAQAARAEIVERIAAAIQRRFRISWIGSNDGTANARALDRAAPLFGGPQPGDAAEPSQQPIDFAGLYDGT